MRLPDTGTNQDEPDVAARMAAPLTPSRADPGGLLSAVSTRTVAAETASLTLPAETAAFSTGAEQ